LAEDEVCMIQIDGPRRRVFIKFTNSTRRQAVLQDKDWKLKFQHDNVEFSQVLIEIAGMGMRRIRIASLPPEVPDRKIRDVLTKYGEVKEIKEELWTMAYRYPVSSGIQIVEMSLKYHIPSHISIA